MPKHFSADAFSLAEQCFVSGPMEFGM